MNAQKGDGKPSPYTDEMVGTPTQGLALRGIIENLGKIVGEQK